MKTMLPLLPPGPGGFTKSPLPGPNHKRVTLRSLELMNGGESGNSVSCYPQYTAYHAWQISNWLSTSPTIRVVDGEPGIYTWSPETSAYEVSEPSGAGSMDIASVGGPVATIIGAFGHDPAEARIYPPIHFSSGNVYAHPDATSDTVDPHYDGSQYFVTVRYADGTDGTGRRSGN